MRGTNRPVCDGQSKAKERTRQGARDERTTRNEFVSGRERERLGVRGGQVLDRWQ